jgi:DNA-binding FadR family transcriptional regulator
MTGQVRQPPRFHQQLVKVLTGKDVGAADAAMREHVRFGVEETVRTIKLLEPGLERKWRVGRTGGV